MNLLDTNLPWHMQLVLLLDWAGHTYVTAEFFAAVALAACGLFCVWALERRRLTRRASTLPGPPPPDGFLTLPAARRLADEAAAKRRAGDGEGALRLYMDVVRRGAGPATRSELFAGWLQAAAELSRDSGCLMQALKLMQLQKFCYENAAVAGGATGAERRGGVGAVGGGGGGGGGEDVGEASSAEGSAEDGGGGDGCGAASLTLTQQRCHDFCRISRLFLSKQNSTMVHRHRRVVRGGGCVAFGVVSSFVFLSLGFTHAHTHHHTRHWTMPSRLTR